MRDMVHLSLAFEVLKEEGVASFHNHMCCGGCASADIGAKHTAGKLPGMVGAVYYHQQDAEGAISSRPGLYLGYGALSGAIATDVDIAEEVMVALREQGFKPEWNGSPANRIYLPGFQATLDEIPIGEGSSLHDEADEDEDDDYWGDEGY